MAIVVVVLAAELVSRIRRRLQMESLCVCCDDTEELDAHSRPEDVVYDYARVDSSYISATMLKALNLAIIKAIDAGYLDDWARDKVQAAMEELREDFRVFMSPLSNEQKAVHAFCC